MNMVKKCLEAVGSKQMQQDSKTKKLIEELSNMSPMVIETAYLHALNYTLFGENVAEKWLTATQQACVLEKAYNKGYYDALQKYAEPDECRRNMEEILEVMNSDADTETKCKMIFDILTAKPHYFEKQEPKPGHWIKYDNEYFAEGRLSPVTRSIIECSACHAKIVDFCGKMYYCPYCGEQKESEGEYGNN